MAFYRPTFLYPDNQAIDPSVDNDFTCQVNVSGEAVSNAKIIILDLANTEIYSATPTISPTLYDKETMSITIPSGTLTAGVTYKQKVTCNPTAATPTYSKETLFYSYSNPTLTFAATPTSITTKSYEFVLTYLQAQSISLKQWKIIWFDENDDILEDSGWSASGNLRYTFDGFSDGETYSVIGYIVNQLGQEAETAKLTFSVSYAKPSVNINSVLTLDKETSIFTSTWGSVVQNQWVHSATPTYINEFLFVDNIAIDLQSGETMYLNVDILNTSSIVFLIKMGTGFDGDFCKLENTDAGTYYKVGYDYSLKRFYSNINGYIEYTDTFESEDTYLDDDTILEDDTVLGTTIKIYAIKISPTKIRVREVGTY